MIVIEMEELLHKFPGNAEVKIICDKQSLSKKVVRLEFGNSDIICKECGSLVPENIVYIVGVTE